MINQALILIKPHVFDNVAVRDRIASILDDQGVTIRYRTETDGPAVEALGLIDRHYALNARAGTCEDPSTLTMDADARKLFQRFFGLGWHEALAADRVVSGSIMQQRLRIDCETLNRRWQQYGFNKLGAGLYASCFTDQNIFVLNGFYPSLRAVLSAIEARIGIWLVAFSPDRLPWQRFRREVIGATLPEAAAPGSIRGICHANRAAWGLNVSYRENIVHASASAFEAAVERHIWLPDAPVGPDPLTFDAARLEGWRDANPLLRLNGRRAPLVDLLEDADTVTAAKALRDWLTKGQLA